MQIQKKSDQALSFSLFVAAIVTMTVLVGCGGGGGGSGSGSTSNGDPAPASVAGKTFNGHIEFLGGTDVRGSNITWQIVFSDSTYTYSERRGGSDSGSYNYTKTGSNSGVVALSDGTTLDLTYNAVNSGSYNIPRSSESGTFTSN